MSSNWVVLCPCLSFHRKPLSEQLLSEQHLLQLSAVVQTIIMLHYALQIKSNIAHLPFLPCL